MTGMSKDRRRKTYAVCGITGAIVISVIILAENRRPMPDHELAKSADSPLPVPASTDVSSVHTESSPFSLADPDSGRATTQPGESAVLDNQYASPLQMITPDDSQSQVLYEAEQVVVQQCMNEMGFDYSLDDSDQTDEVDGNPDPVDLNVPNEANARGYGLVESMTTEASVDTSESVATGTGANLKLVQENKNDLMIDRMDKQRKQAWRQALVGNVGGTDTWNTGSMVEIETPSMDVMSWDSNSCTSAAWRAIYGSDVKFMEEMVAVEALEDKIWQAVETNSNYENALQKWQSCMAVSGLGYDYPGQAAGQLATDYFEGRLTLHELKAREIDVASKDAHCYQSSNFKNATELAEKQGELEVFQGNREIFESLQNSLVSATETANRVLR